MMKLLFALFGRLFRLFSFALFVQSLLEVAKSLSLFLFKILQKGGRA